MAQSWRSSAPTAPTALPRSTPNSCARRRSRISPRCFPSASTTRPTGSRRDAGSSWPIPGSRRRFRAQSARAGSPTSRSCRSFARWRRTPHSWRSVQKAQHECKARFADWVKRHTDVTVDPHTIFDCQIKRIHEYKRQLLNALRIVVLYQRLRENPGLDIPPRTFFFAGKAAPAYYLAKVIIKFINNLAQTIDADPAMRGKLKVVFLPEYNVTLAERCIPCGRCLEPDFHRRLRGERHQQHEVHDERRADHRDARRRHDRNGRGGGRREFLPVRPHRAGSGQQPTLVQPPLALRK